MSAAPVLRSVWAAGAAAKPAAATASPVTAPRTMAIESLAFYRKHTEALLRQYMRKSLEVGRTPSLLGNCMFRGKVSSRRLRSFEDVVIFVFDIEKCLARLDRFAQDLIARLVFQEYSQVETAKLTGYPLRTIVRKYAETIDALTEIFLELDLLNV